MKKKTKQRGFCLGLIMALIMSSMVNLTMGVRTAEAVPPDHLVISEVQIAGNTSTDEFVEIYNPTGASVSLDGWSLKKRTGSGTESNLVTSFPVVSINAGAHFLITHQTGYEGTTPADLTFSGSTFTVSTNNTVLLVDSSDAIVDMVGYGSVVSYEGSPYPDNPGDNESITRAADGHDSDNNALDFVLVTNPTPQNSSGGGGDEDMGGTVSITITPDTTPVQNITPVDADIVFQVNGSGEGIINYGQTSSYGETSDLIVFMANTETAISLDGLLCGTTYHYSIHAENGSDPTDTDDTQDAVFTTLDCGIDVNSLEMTEMRAKANDQYSDGWEWEFNITVWDLTETELNMRFDSWTGASSLDAAGNMEFSVDGGANWIGITENGEYPSSGTDISGIDTNASLPGRQVEIVVRMKVPFGVVAGEYYSNYGILTE